MALSLPPAAQDIKLLTRKHYLLEAACWLIGIALLALTDPAKEHLFSLCPFRWVTELSCPGCGLGHALGWLFRGNVAASWEAHPLGVPALLLLVNRQYVLCRNFYLMRKLYLKQTQRYDKNN